MQKNYIIGGIVIVAVIGIFLMFGMPKAGQGRVVFAVTDQGSLPQIDVVTFSVDKIEVHSATEAEESGWTTVSTEKKSYNLLFLKQQGQLGILADVKLNDGIYNGIRLHVSEVFVTGGGTTKSAKLPSDVIKIGGKLVVKTNTTSMVTVDVDAEHSLHMTGKGDYIFTPVLKLNTRSMADVQVSAEGMVTSTGGNQDSEVNVGMDEKGEVKEDFILDTDTELDVDVNGVIKLK